MILGGTCDLAYVSPMSKGFDLLGANDLPFVISKTAISMDVANGLYRSGLFSSMFEKNGFKPLYFQPTDPFSFFFRKNKITTLDELTPLKLRGVTPPQIALIKALGASGVAIPTTDLYMALDRGTVDGLISSPEYCLSAKLFEVLKYCIWEPVGTPVGAVVMNFKTWKSLPPDVQVIIEELNQEVRYKFMDLQKSSQKYREELTQRGITVYDLSQKESELWHAKGETLIKDWVEDKKAKGQPGQEIVNFIYKTISQYER
jgi:TRAP-type C4-dicarboxylate transport system substrate-binding protein